VVTPQSLNERTDLFDAIAKRGTENDIACQKIPLLIGQEHNTQTVVRW